MLFHLITGGHLTWSSCIGPIPHRVLKHIEKNATENRSLLSIYAPCLSIFFKKILWLGLRFIKTSDNIKLTYPQS